MKTHYSMTLYQKKYRYNKIQKEDSELNLASLLDVLVIILFFLILNYNPTDLQINLVGKTHPAESTLNEYGHSAVTIQVNWTQDLYIDGTLVGNLSNRSLRDKTIQALKMSKANQELMYKNINREPTSNYDASSVNIIFDGELDFDIIHQVMSMSSASGFTNFKLIVKGSGHAAKG